LVWVPDLGTIQNSLFLVLLLLLSFNREGRK
jgi:hypothetical protein